MKTASIWLSLLMTGLVGTATAQVSATVSIDTTQTTPVNPNFSGFNDEVPFPAEFYDYRLNNIATQLSPGWVRYPSGLFSDAFDWQTGLMNPSWVSQFSATNIYTLLSESIAWVGGKGGGSFVDGANRANFLGAKLIVDVNAYTDTPESAGQMAAFALANDIPVAAWELANEPYLYPGFFASGADYVAAVKPYRDAIKAANPNAIVAIFFQDAADTNPNPAWDASIASYPDKYWDAVTFHHYPAQSTGPFSQWMADENAVLVSKTSDYVTGHLVPLNPPGTVFLESEFLPSNDGLATDTSLTDGTLYGAVYAAEYVMRMATVPSMKYVGMHAMTGQRGIYATQTNYTNVRDAYDAGTSIDTLTLDFGYYLTAQPLGLAVLNGVINQAAVAYATTVTGGSTVAATGLGQIPALYAQAYTSAAGLRSVVITNKGATANQVTISSVDGPPILGPLAITYIAGSDPTAQNTSAADSPVAVQTSTSGNPVTIPAYSVVRVDLNSPASVTAASSASFAVGTVAPQEIVALFGNGISSQTLLATLPLPTALGGTSVQIKDSTGNTELAPLIAVSSGQANIVVPSGLANGPATIMVLHGSTAVLNGITLIASSAPGLFSINSDGSGAAAAEAFTLSASNQTTYQTLYTCNPPAVRSCLVSPLSLGQATDTLYVALYGTGIRGAKSVQCFVGGQSVTPLYAGPVASYAGLDQVNIAIPRSLAGTGDVRVYLVADGVSSNVVVLNIK
jgi:uncharacterized protein (TIGR03437 family)